MSDYESDYDNNEIDDYGSDDINNYIDEVGAYERAGFGELTELLGYSTLPSLEGAREITDPIDRFVSMVYAVSKNISDSGKMQITDNEIIEMLSKVRLNLVKHVVYKNPLAYVLGFVVTRGGGNINTSVFNTIVNIILPYILTTENTVLPEDVVRYARFWKTIN
jgi:hypothetical protein